MLCSCPTLSHFSLPCIFKKKGTLVPPLFLTNKEMEAQWITSFFTEGLPRPAVWVTWESHPCHQWQRTCSPSVRGNFHHPEGICFYYLFCPSPWRLMRGTGSTGFWPFFKWGNESWERLPDILRPLGWQVAELDPSTAFWLRFLSTGSPCPSERPPWPRFNSSSETEIYRTYNG